MIRGYNEKDLALFLLYEKMITSGKILFSRESPGFYRLSGLFFIRSLHAVLASRAANKLLPV